MSEILADVNEAIEQVNKIINGEYGEKYKGKMQNEMIADAIAKAGRAIAKEAIKHAGGSLASLAGKVGNLEIAIDSLKAKKPAEFEKEVRAMYSRSAGNVMLEARKECRELTEKIKSCRAANTEPLLVGMVSLAKQLKELDLSDDVITTALDRYGKSMGYIIYKRTGDDDVKDSDRWVECYE